MKRNKLKQLLVSLATTSLVVASIPVLATLTSCTQKVDVDDSQDNSAYTIVLFQGLDSDVVFEGATRVRAKVGRQFCSIKAPKATRLGQKFSKWVYIDGTGKQVDLTDDFLIPADGLTVYPIFENILTLSNCVGFAAIEETTINIVQEGGDDADIGWTTDYGEHWTKISDPGVTPSVHLNPGGNVFFRGDNELGFSESTTKYTHFTFTEPDAAVNVGGNIMGLLDNAEGTIKQIPNGSEYCFYHLFSGGSAIKYISDTFLPATTLQPHCYDGMFGGCTSLMTAPTLPTKEVSPTNAAGGCYANMFNGCSSLNLVKLGAEAFNDNCFENWLAGVSTTGEIVYNGTAPGSRGPSSIPNDWNIDAPTPEGGITITTDESVANGCVVNHPYKFNAVIAEGHSQRVTWTSSDARFAQVNPDTGIVTGVAPTAAGQKITITCLATDGSGVKAEKQIEIKAISLDKCTKVTVDSPAVLSWNYVGEGNIPELKYSTDGKAWLKMWPGADIDIGSTTGSTTYYIKGNNPNGLSAPTNDAYAHITFKPKTSGGNLSVTLGGTIMSLVDDGRGIMTNIPTDYCFNKVFSGNEYITSISDDYLPSSNLKKGCYASLFSECSSLTKAPKLPAKTLTNYCYQSMFSGCASLIQTPTLEANVLGEFCYQHMFSGCTTLTASPSLPATEAAKGCYYSMFQNCKSITSIGTIGLTTLADWCCFQTFASVASRTRQKFGESRTRPSKYFWRCPQYVDDKDQPTHYYVYNMFTYDDALTTAFVTPTSQYYVYCN